MPLSKTKSDALKIEEFFFWIEATCESDFEDADTVTSYIEREWSDRQVIQEMEYFLECYYEEGHTLNLELIGEFGIESKVEAKKTVRAINRFLKKHS